MPVNGLAFETTAQNFVHVLGIRFNRMTRKQVVEQILHWVSEKSRRTIITAGPEFVMMTHTDAEVKRIAQLADIVTPDGIGVVWAARRVKHPVPERVTGVELVQELLHTAEERKQSLRVFILGARDEALNKCLERFRSQYPHAVFAGQNGYFQASDVPDVLQQIEAFAPDIWLVGLGQPRQEKLIVHSLGSLPPCVAIGVGGSIDVWSGIVKRAPVLFRKLNLEWLYRLLKQPSRMRRQMALPKFAWKVLKDTARRP